jgi:hypothetical protein
MRHQVTEPMKVLVEELHDLRQLIEARLTLASSAARDEWDRLCTRIPRRDELDSGFVPLCEAELDEMKSKISRFAQILRGLGASLGGVTPPSPGVAKPTQRPS